MPFPKGTHQLGPDGATLTIRTGRAGAAAKAGHDLLLEATSWEATLEVGDDAATTSAELSVDGTSLRVRRGEGGIKSLSDADKREIEGTIDEEVLKRTAVRFSSNQASGGAGDERIHFDGDLSIRDTTKPISFELASDDEGSVGGSTTVRQSTWGVKPYSAMLGALKVANEVEVTIDGKLRNEINPEEKT
ncbi:MAG: YceI family protein [Solirubrobacterales bacterium]